MVKEHTFPPMEECMWGNGRMVKLNGQGTSISPDGRKYVGEYKNGKRNGQGTGTFPDGRMYVGEWKNGKQNGHGTETIPNVGKYVGEWRNGKTNGQGTLTSPNGHKYVGEFKDDKRWNGTSYDQNGKIESKIVNGKRQFENGKRISMLGNSRMENIMVKEHTLFMMEVSM